MSYGKQKQGLEGVKNRSFRQSTHNAGKSNYSKKPRSGVPYFVDKYEPSQLEIDNVRLLQGEYLQEQVEGEGDEAHLVQVVLPFVKFTEHFDGAHKRGGICSAGPWASFRDKRGPCHGCDIYWETAARNAAGRFESTRMSRQSKYVFAVFDYGRYHKLDVIDKDKGTPKINPQTKLPYFNWTKCQGMGCDACRAKVETKYGDSRHWPLNYTQLQVLQGAELHVGRSCAVCCTENIIQSLGWMCGSCGEEVIDMSTTTLKMDELIKMTEEPYNCPKCKTAELLTELYDCPVCSPRGQTGARATLFDVDLRVQLVKTGDGKKILQVSGWSAPRPIPPEFAEAAKPADLVARYAPDSLEQQAAKFHVSKRSPVPEGEQAPARAYQNPYAPKQS